MRPLRKALVALAAAAALTLSLAPATQSARADIELNAAAQDNFIRALVGAARQNQTDTGIPASVAIGQAALETGWGRSKMAQPPINSYFSIKCGASTPFSNGCVNIESYEYDKSGNKYLEVSSFRTYETVGHSLRDYGRLLSSASRYKPAFQHEGDPDAFIRAVHKAGYATDPNYSDIVISIMRRYDLYAYDLKPAPMVPVAGFNPDWFPKPLPAAPAKPAVVPEFVEGPDFPGYAIGVREQGVQTLQHLLNAQNAAGLATDGIFGAGTDAAVINWQNRIGAKATGVMDDQSWLALVPPLAEGARGGAVTALQQELTQAGFTTAVNGTFDAATRRAVSAFQAHHSIRPTGEVGAVLWARLLDW